MTKVHKSMTNAFKRICKDHVKRKINAIQMIRTLGNTLLNLQQNLSQQGVHIALSLPLNHSSIQFVFINTCPMEEQTFILKPLVRLKQELDNSDDVMCHTIIDYYIQRPLAINHICLAEFVFEYMKNGKHI